VSPAGARRRIVNPWRWTEKLGFVSAVETTGAQRVLYCAGITSVDDHGRPVHDGDMEAQALHALSNLETVLSEAGLTLADVTRLNFYVTDVPAFHAAAGALNRRLAAADCRYVGTLLGVAALAHPEHLIEMEATAAR
jgi:enamine deaminase RidA (YjgF/YER057c/UK114 family)